MNLMLLCGCGSEEAFVPSAHDLAGELMSEVTFEDTMGEVSTNTALRCYDMESSDVEESVVYMSTGATAEELAVFHAASESSADRLLARLTERRDAQLRTYLEYKPAETDRLEAAVLFGDGEFVVYVVSDDSDKAENIVASYLGQR